MTSSAARRKRLANGPMRGIRFYVLFFGTNALLWAIVTMFGHRL